MTETINNFIEQTINNKIKELEVSLLNAKVLISDREISIKKLHRLISEYNNQIRELKKYFDTKECLE